MRAVAGKTLFALIYRDVFCFFHLPSSNSSPVIQCFNSPKQRSQIKNAFIFPFIVQLTLAYDEFPGLIIFPQRSQSITNAIQYSSLNIFSTPLSVNHRKLLGSSTSFSLTFIVMPPLQLFCVALPESIPAHGRRNISRPLSMRPVHICSRHTLASPSFSPRSRGNSL